MCSRFENTVSPDTIGKRYGAVAPEGYRPAAEIRPDNSALMIAGDGAHLARFGLQAKWDKKLILNARRETLAERPTFKRLLERRCLVPASAWFEWRDEPCRRGKVKYRLHRRDGLPMAFAGLYDGQRIVIVTKAAVPSIAEIHDRMPAILPDDLERDWIASGKTFADVGLLLDRPPPALVADLVSPPPRQSSLF